jgi:hypothetical protein
MKTLLSIVVLGLCCAAAAQDPSAKPVACDEHGMLDIRLNPTGNDVEPPVVVYLVSPSGKRFGTDPRKKRAYDEIPQVSYKLELVEEFVSEEELPKAGVLEICNPEEGVYKLVLSGTREGNFDVEVEAVARDGSSTEMNSSNNPINADQEQRFTIRYFNRPGEQVKMFRDTSSSK